LGNYSVTANSGMLAILVAPVFQSVVEEEGMVTLTWSSTPGQSYQVQYATDLARLNWVDLGAPLVATNSLLALSEAMGSNSWRFYRVGVQP
jgi:hypothetical protein